MKKLLIIFIILFSYSSVNAEITDMNENFSLLCETEQSTGFRWIDNDWTKTNWKLQRYIITKQDYEPSSDMDKAEHIMCTQNKIGDYYDKRSDILFRDSCYLIKKFGDKTDVLNYKTCMEEWGDSPFTLNKVTCSLGSSKSGVDGVVFTPDGWFTKYRIAQQVSNIPKPISVNGEVIIEAGRKDDMFIEVGRCSAF